MGYIDTSDVGAVLRGSLAQNGARTLISALAIALGVALGFAVQLVNQSAVEELTQSVRTLSGDADLAVRGPRGGFDETIFSSLARDPEIAMASPVIELDVRIADRSEPLRVLGLDAFRAGAIQPGLVGNASDTSTNANDGLDLLRPDAIFLSNAAMRWLGVARGDSIILQAGLGDVRVRVAGLLAGAGQQRIGVMDIAGAQVAFERLGRLSRIDLRVKPGVIVDSVRDRLAATLPAGVAIERPAATLRATESISRSYRVNLNVLSLVALFTGGLLVFSTQALAVVRRRSQFALLRTLGVTRGRLAALCVLEGALIGLAGGALGVAAGYAIALAGVRFVGGDLGSGYFRGVVPSLNVSPAALFGFVALGMVASMLGSLLPAREAANAAPARALKAGDEETALARLRPPALGFAVMALGGGLVLLPAVHGLPLAGYAAIACLLVGTLLVIPALSVALLSRLPTPSQAPQALAVAQLKGAPGQLTVSLAAMVASVSLMVSMAIMVASFRQSLEDWLDRVLPAALYLRGPSSEVAILTPEAQARIRSTRDVTRAEFLREEHLLLDPSRPRVVLLARPLVEREVESRLPLVDPPRTRPPDAAPPVWVNEAMVDLYQFTPGKTITLPIAGRDQRFFVAGVWRDYGRPQGAVQIELDRYVAATGDRTVSAAALWLAKDADPRAIGEAIRQGIAGGERLEIAAPGEIRALSLAAFDRTFAVTYALEFAAVLIGLVGLSSAFGALVLARRREFGVLRHLGMTRRQIGTMLATEGLISGALGVGVGMVLGAAISLILIHVVNRQSFHWGMEVSMPGAALALFAVVVVMLASVTAVVSGRRAMAQDAVRAVKEDW